MYRSHIQKTWASMDTVSVSKNMFPPFHRNITFLGVLGKRKQWYQRNINALTYTFFSCPLKADLNMAHVDYVNSAFSLDP